MQSEEQSKLKLRRYLHLTRACRDIATKIPPYYEKMYPSGVGQMTALYPELSKAPLAMKIEFFFPGNPAHPSKICQVLIELWCEKTMYMHCVDCPRVFLLLSQEGARMPRHWNLPVEQSQHVVSPKKIILRKNVPNWDIWNQSRRCFCWKFTMCTEIVRLMWVLCTISEVTQTLILNMF